MRVDVKKFLCVGPLSRKNTFFQEAQKNGVVQFINPHSHNTSEWPASLQELKIAHKLVRSKEEIPQEKIGGSWTPHLLAEHIIATNNEIELIQDELRQLKHEIIRIEPFGDFSKTLISEIENKGKLHFQYYFSKKTSPQSLAHEPHLFHLSSRLGINYYLSITPEKRDYEGLVEMLIPMSLGTLNKKFVQLKERMHSIQNELKEFSKYAEGLKNALFDGLDAYQLHVNKDFVTTGLDERLFYVEAWVAEHQLSTFHHVLDKNTIHADEIRPENNETPPTFLDNQGIGRIGQDVIQVYDIPSHQDKDPSKWVFWAFAFFFAFIVGDGGYGLIFLLLSIFLYIKFPKAKGLGRRFINLCTTISFFCIGWGILTSSFFGLDIGLHNPIRNVSIVQYLSDSKAEYLMNVRNENFNDWAKLFPKVTSAKTAEDFYQATERNGNLVALGKFGNNALLELSLVIGILHLILSFLRRAKEHWAGFGWILFLIGGYLYFPTILKADSLLYYVFGIDPVVGAAWGLKVLLFGICFAVVIALVQHKAGGATELMNLIQVFSDVLSYLRLFALALAGGMMSSTFNSMGAEAGWFFGFFIIIIGQVVNIALSILGGIIHGLRLNFLEWYHYCFDGGGKLFEPLALLKRR